jgi:diguanylate cyclase (GGDEF)-like protein
VGTNFLEYLAPADLERAGTLFARLMAGADVVSEELELVAKGGQPVFLDVSARPIVEGGQLVGVEGIARDMTERRALLDALTYQALHDPLTGLPNRTLFGDRLGHALALSRRHSSTVALMLLDLDNFKLVNDSLGHSVGDEVLVAVAWRLDRKLRTSESLMRLGGDEFAVIVEDAKTESELAAVAARILSALTEPLAVDDRVGQITASLGIALSQPGDDPASLLRKADIAMYQAKAEHPGHFRFYDQKTPEFPQPENARPRSVSHR